MRSTGASTNFFRELAIVLAAFAGLLIAIGVLGWLQDEFHIPVWLMIAGFLLALAGCVYVIFRPDLRRFREWRRHSSQRCPSCGYDRRGLEIDAACPECGKVKA